MASNGYPCLSDWSVEKEAKTTVVPQNHWLLLRHPGPFRWDLRLAADSRHGESFAIEDGSHLALIPPGQMGEANLTLQCQHTTQTAIGAFLFVPSTPAPAEKADFGGMVLLTNDRGGMSRMAVDLGNIYSKYDAALAANLHPSWPVDRHVLLKRFRAWADADGFFAPLNRQSLVDFAVDAQSAHWHFRVACGNQRLVDIHLQAWMPQGANALCTRWWRGGGDEDAKVSLIIRPDLEDRSFHAETERNKGSEAHFRQHLSASDRGNGDGCRFEPAKDRFLDIVGPDHSWNSDEEWTESAHPIEATRGQKDRGAAWSPGYFRFALDR